MSFCSIYNCKIQSVQFIFSPLFWMSMPTTLWQCQMMSYVIHSQTCTNPQVVKYYEFSLHHLIEACFQMHSWFYTLILIPSSQFRHVTFLVFDFLNGFLLKKGSVVSVSQMEHLQSWYGLENFLGQFECQRNWLFPDVSPMTCVSWCLSSPFCVLSWHPPTLFVYIDDDVLVSL